jgi:simple sugar transport system ATP-binding protein
MDKLIEDKNRDEDYLVKMIGIEKWFGRVQALMGIDLNIKKSEIVGLVGDNGAGKSTLIKVLSGYHVADKGEIFIKGDKVNIKSPRVSRNLGIETVYQDQALAPDMDISRNIFMGRELTYPLGILKKRQMDNESMKTLENLGLKLNSASRNISTLSGGQRQGVTISRAIYFKAELVILDEPTAALSVKEVGEVLQFIKDIRNQGISVIFITHNLYHVFSIADRIVVISHGYKIADVEKGNTTIEKLSELIVKGTITI